MYLEYHSISFNKCKGLPGPAGDQGPAGSKGGEGIPG